MVSLHTSPHVIGDSEVKVDLKNSMMVYDMHFLIQHYTIYNSGALKGRYQRYEYVSHPGS